MSIRQLSVFVENRPGHLADARPGDLAGTLSGPAEGRVNVLSFTIADTGDYGILRLVVDQVEHAKDLLETAGYAVVEPKTVLPREGCAARVIDRRGV